MARRSDHTRDEIKAMALAAAKGIVADHGYRALTTRKVAAAIGYTVGSLYLVFDNLDDLVLHINADTLDALDQALQQVDAREGDPAARLLALARAYAQFARRNASLWRLVFEHPLPTPRPAWFQVKVERMFAVVERLLRDICPDRPAEELAAAARALWSGVHGVTVLAMTERLDTPDAPAAHELIDSLVTNYLRGYTARA
ncbi:TetR/AcrR family transcriptional regulator [Ectothiorhodospiraceae bacterium 2226]|nr:TetR/AcrR family transcriptional regulator [Ectothiorhodospiraceae bacterium 2226]